MKRSTIHMGEDATDKLEAWIASSNYILRTNGQVIKAELCRRLAISRSAADTKIRIRAMLATLEGQANHVPAIFSNAITSKRAKHMGEHDFGDTNDSDECSVRIFRHLLMPGRVIR